MTKEKRNEKQVVITPPNTTHTVKQKKNRHMQTEQDIQKQTQSYIYTNKQQTKGTLREWTRVFMKHFVTNPKS